MPNALTDFGVGAPNPLAYAVNGDGTVTDLVTGLVWQQAAPTTKYAWADAVAFCPTLTLAGHADWRLPTEIELVTLVDDSLANPGPVIDPTAFPGAPADWFWSSTPLAGESSIAWYVSFDSGYTTTSVTTSMFYVRCVRSALVPTVPGPAPAGRYTIAGSTVYDTKTLLTWQRAPAAMTYVDYQAMSYCAGVGATLGGTGWRLPTKKELLTVVDFSVPLPGPTIDATAFPGTPTSEFWSATPVADTTTSRWGVTFDVGAAVSLLNGDAVYVRCVR